MLVVSFNLVLFCLFCLRRDEHSFSRVISLGHLSLSLSLSPSLFPLREYFIHNCPCLGSPSPILSSIHQPGWKGGKEAAQLLFHYFWPFVCCLAEPESSGNICATLLLLLLLFIGPIRNSRVNWLHFLRPYSTQSVEEKWKASLANIWGLALADR